MEEPFGYYCKKGTEGLDVLVMEKVSYEQQQLYRLRKSTDKINSVRCFI